MIGKGIFNRSFLGTVAALLLATVSFLSGVVWQQINTSKVEIKPLNKAMFVIANYKARKAYVCIVGRDCSKLTWKE